jgi:predicted ferric reductase
MKKYFLYFIFFANLFVTLAFWWHTSGVLLRSGDHSSIIISLGRVVGLLGEFFILVQLVIMGRIRFVEHEFGLDKLNNLHRKIGYTWGSLIILHPLLLTIGYAKSNGVSLLMQFVDFFQHWQDVWKAIIGLAVMYIAIAISISIIRKKLKYETWYFTHLLIYGSIALFFGHQVNTGDADNTQFYYYWYVINFTVFGLVLVYRFLRPPYLALRYQFKIEKIVPENALVNSVYITGKNLKSFKVEAGQYAHFNFLAKGMWQTHPFSFSAAVNGEHLRLSIKKSGDFTSRIQNLTPGTKVLIDGPFGVFSERSAITKKFLFIAGGIGITPINALIESMSPRGSDMILLYGNRYKQDSTFFHELSHWGAKVYHIFSMEEERGHEFGYVDEEKILRLAPDFKDRDIYICGPAIMMDKLIILFQKLGVPKNQVHFERFNY